MNSKEKSRILIFRHELLPWSETFLLDQAENLCEFDPIYCGLQRVSGLETAPEKTIIIRDSSKKGWVRGELFRAFRWSPSLIPELRRRGIRLIHAHFEGGGMAMTRLSRALDVPLLVTCHGIDVTKKNKAQWPNPAIRRVWLRRRAELQRHGRLFLGVSSFICRRMIDLGYPAERTQVHYTGVKVSLPLPDRDAARDPIVLFAGRLVEKKGCRFALEAMQTVQAITPEIQLLVAGDGPLRSDLEAEARSRGLNARFLGQCTKSEVLGWMSRSLLLCAPFLPASDGDTDGCPTILLEAQSIGLPVVAFAHGGSIEALNHGATGLLVPVGDSMALAAAILRLCQDQELWIQFRKAGRRWVEKQFDLRKQNARLEELYKQAIAGFPQTDSWGRPEGHSYPN